MLFQWVPCIVHGTHELSKTFIKNESHGTIYKFKNYFATVFSIFNNKRYLNRPLLIKYFLKVFIHFNKKILPPSHFVCPLFHFEISQIIVLFLKIRVINLLMFLLYPYLLMFLLIIQFFDKII